MATSTPQDDYIKTALRLPRDLHRQIVEGAEKSGRSMNAEIVSRLEQSVSGEFERLSNRFHAEQFQAAAGRINALSLAVVLKNISDNLAPSLKESDEPFAKTVIAAQKLASQAAKALLETADADAAVMKTAIDALIPNKNKKASD